MIIFRHRRRHPGLDEPEHVLVRSLERGADLVRAGPHSAEALRRDADAERVPEGGGARYPRPALEVGAVVILRRDPGEVS